MSDDSFGKVSYTSNGRSFSNSLSNGSTDVGIGMFWVVYFIIDYFGLRFCNFYFLF